MHPVPARHLTCHHTGAVSDWVPPPPPTPVAQSPVVERPEPAQPTPVPAPPVQERPAPVQLIPVPESPLPECHMTAPPTLLPEFPVQERSESSPSTPCISQDSDSLDNTSLALLEREVTDRRVHQRGTRAPKQLHEPPEHWHVGDSGIVGTNQCIDDHPPRTIDSLEERRNRQERRRTQLTPTNARVMSYPRVRADSRESTSRESTFRESAATESERTISRESTPPSSTESTPPLDPPGRACPGEPPDEAPAGACILPSYSNPGSSVSLSFV